MPKSKIHKKVTVQFRVSKKWSNAKHVEITRYQTKYTTSEKGDPL